MRLVSLAAGGLALLALTGCSSATSTKQATEMDGATKAWLICLHAEAHAIDDGKSDPLSIAIALQPLCQSWLKRVEEITGAGLSYNAYQILVSRIEADAIETSVTVVLQERKKA